MLSHHKRQLFSLSGQECGEFCAQVSDVLAVHQRLNNNAIYGDPSGAPCDSADPSAGGESDSAAYERYLASSHLVDGPGVVRALRRLRGAATAEAGVPGWQRPAVVHGRPASLLERAAAALLTGDEPVAVRRAGGEEGVEREDAETAEGVEREDAETAEGETEDAETAEGETETEKRGGDQKPELELVRTVWHCVDVQPATEAKGPASATDSHVRNMFSE